jgi:biotin operon repressor
MKPTRDLAADLIPNLMQVTLSWQADPRPDSGLEMRKDVREFIRRLEAVGLTVESTPGHYRVLREGKPLRKANGMPFALPFSPDTIRWRRAAIVELRKLGIDL